MQRLIVPLFLAVISVAMASDGADRNTFFGTIPRLEGGEVSRLRDSILAMGRDCDNMGKRCAAIEEFYAIIAGRLNLSSFPAHIVYVGKDGEVYTNLIIHRHKVTPYLYGQSNVWVLVFSERELGFEAHLTTLWQKRSAINPELQNIFISEGQRTKEGRESSGLVHEIELNQMSGESTETDLWYGATRFFLEPVVVYQTSVVPRDDATAEAVDFLEARANFSNSPDSSVDLGLALGATLHVDPEDAKNLDGVRFGDANLNLYVALDIYLIKPTLLHPMRESLWGRYRPSIGITIGTNLTFWESTEFNVGVNFGHLFGRHGLIVGANIINPLENDSDQRVIRPYLAGFFNF
jgi:hypothetical protein